MSLRQTKRAKMSRNQLRNFARARAEDLTKRLEALIRKNREMALRWLKTMSQHQKQSQKTKTTNLRLDKTNLKESVQEINWEPVPTAQ
jgi:hypothetical protein